jgi:hypothetical protein
LQLVAGFVGWGLFACLFVGLSGSLAVYLFVCLSIGRAIWFVDSLLVNQLLGCLVVYFADWLVGILDG